MKRSQKIPAPAPSLATGPIEAAPDPCRVLGDAARRVAADWCRQNSGDAVSLEELDVLLSCAVAMVLRALAGETENEYERLASVLGRRLIELLRAEVIRLWRTGATSPPSDHILAVLGAFETVRARIEPNWAQHFASRLSGIDGLGLVVQVAHDFRSPLSAVLFLADLMLKGRSGDLTSLQHRQVALMYSATLSLSELASNVIEMAADGNRLTDHQPSSFSLQEILDSVSSIVRPMAEEKGVAVRVLLAANPFRVGHPRALSRVLLNLTVNALKFTEKGSVQITVQEIRPTRLEFSVRDTGKGIDPSRVQTLYEAFRRPPDGDRYAFSGTGLGLSLCRRLVQIMKSELHVETKKGWGTRFFFELDLSLAPPSAMAPPQPDLRLQDHLVATDMLPRSRPLG